MIHVTAIVAEDMKEDGVVLHIVVVQQIQHLAGNVSQFPVVEESYILWCSVSNGDAAAI